jgi:hypothetical protein
MIPAGTPAAGGSAAETTATGPTPAASTSELELYKLAVEMADRISARRALANTFFLTINTGLAALLGGKGVALVRGGRRAGFRHHMVVAAQSYRKLIAAKFQVINELESRLPAQLFGDEWEHLKLTKAPARLWPPNAVRAWLNGYHELGTIEHVVPLVFVGIYTADLLRQVTT